MSEINPNRSSCQSQTLDKKSIRLIKNLLEDHHVEDSQLEEGGSLANIDGYIELLDQEDRIEAKVTVQVKHLTHPSNGNDAYYDIPQSIFGYAERMKGELVIFITCDTDNQIFYWKHISTEFIEEFRNRSKHIQNTIRYHFRDYESCMTETVDSTLNRWRILFQQLANSIKDEKYIAEKFVLCYKSAFHNVPKGFFGISNSRIQRKEVNLALEWINSTLEEKESNICFISGNAGVGKTFIVRDIINSLDENGIKNLCIKADSIDFISERPSFEKILDTIHYLKSDQNKIVVIIDQIDALSQYLTNDRQKINLFVTLLNNLSIEKDVRVIVSCRKFDIEYDDEIKSITKEAKIINVDRLSIEEVKTVINSIDCNLCKQLDTNTIELLRTAQFLEIFCRIYISNGNIINYASVTDLYDSYWRILIYPSETIDSEEIEKCIYEISDLMLSTETLSPCWMPNSKNQRIIDCLASRGVVNIVERHISFFHQSFYDYTLARNFIYKHQNFAEYIESQFQGFEIRSTVKAVFEYVRDHDTNEYKSFLKKLLFSDMIRLHIKYLVLSLIAFEKKPQRFEYSLIKNLCTENNTCFMYFLKCINNESWFGVFRSLVSPLMVELSQYDEMCYPIVNYLTMSAYTYAQEVYTLIESIRDADTRKYVYSFVLRGHNNYQENCVIKGFNFCYNEMKGNIHFIEISIEDALLTNSNFAVDVVNKLISSFLQSPEEYNKRHESYALIDVLCKKLAQKYTDEFLCIIHSIFIRTVSLEPSYSYNDYVKVNSIFGKHMDDYVEKLYKLYKRAFISSKHTDLKCDRVNELLQTMDEKAICLALEVMSNTPCLYSSIIDRLLEDPNLIDGYLQSDAEFYLCQVLRNWYDCQDISRQTEYESFVLNFVSSSDKVPDKGRYFGLLYPHLWYQKWKLICTTVPDSPQLSQTTKSRQELIRRFGRSYQSKKTDNRVAMAEICGGVTTKDNYQKFTIDTWRNSFLKLTDGWKHFRKPIDLRVHASMFEECVSERPAYFFDFVQEINMNDDVKLMYKIAGVKGLIKDEKYLESIWHIVRNFMVKKYACDIHYDIFNLIEIYVNNNLHLDEIHDFLLEVTKYPRESINLPFLSKDINDSTNKVNELLTSALNCTQGKAVNLLLKMCKYPKYREQVLLNINEQRELFSDDIKALILLYIFTNDCYDKKLSPELFKKLIFETGSLAIFINAQTFQYYMYHQPEVVRDYLKNIEIDSTTHSILCQIYYYGLGHPSVTNECKENLERILDKNEDYVIADLIKTAFKSYNYREHHDFAIQYLKRFATDDREAIVHSYCAYCDNFSIDDLKLFIEIFSQIKTTKYIELSDILEYIEKCANRYPVECFRFIKNKILCSNDSKYLHDNILKIIYVIYRRLNEEHDSEQLNDIMQMFEDELYMNPHMELCS